MTRLLRQLVFGSDTAEIDQEFDQLWAVYPRKDGRAYAYKCYVKARKRVDLQVMLDALAWQKQRPSWNERKHGELLYVPHLSTWLNQERWTDERPAPRTEPETTKELAPWQRKALGMQWRKE